jgi:hypothetical protein
MDDPASKSSRPERQMASPRPASSTGSRRARTGGGNDAAHAEIPIARRLGVVLVVATLGGAIALAAWNSRGPGGDPLTTPTPAPEATTPAVAGPTGIPNVVPVVAPPEQPLISRRTWTAEITIPDPGVPLAGLELRVFRNGRQVAREPLGDTLTMRVRNVRLEQGRNEVSAALANAAGVVGLRSQPVVITVDYRPPPLRIREPKSGDVVNSSRVTVRGTTEPDAQLTARNANNDASPPVTVTEDGAFSVDVPLGTGRNQITLTATDALGNERTASVTVTRGDPADNARLTLRPRSLRVSDLPGRLDVRLQVTDPSGKPLDGAPVTFSLSPSGQSTSTYQTTTEDGEAEWSGIQIPRQGAVPGKGLVTALVTLPSGEMITKSVPLEFR